jgi:hypothetical protein
MATGVKKSVFTVLVEDYTTPTHRVTILPPDTNFATVRARPRFKHNIVQQWYLSLQGEESPGLSETEGAAQDDKKTRVYRYDWAFGVTLIRGFWWDWMADLADEDALAVHLVLQQDGDIDAIPIAGTLNALHPSRNTQSLWERTWPLLPKTAADVAKVGSAAIPALNYVATGLMATSNVIESQTARQKNWFLYQFVDELRHCPTVEWRINRKVFEEYGPLIRGALFVAFYGDPSQPSRLKMSLRPQVRFSRARDLDFIVPTDALHPGKQVYLDIAPQASPRELPERNV